MISRQPDIITECQIETTSGGDEIGSSHQSTSQDD